MLSIDEFPGREFSINGKEYLYFGGTSYLGLQTNPDFQALFVKNIQKYGTGYGASRQSNIQMSIFKEVEYHLSQIVGSKDCITLSSGYLAGQLLHDYLSSKNHTLFYSPNTHSALYRSGQFIFNDWHALTTALNNYCKNNKSSAPVLFLDSIDFEGLHFPDYKILQKLPLKDIILVVDDSHGIGITGENGGGSYGYLTSLHPKALIVTCSLGKGYGIPAGAIFGNQEIIKNLKNTAFFGGASPASPAALATLKEAEQLYVKKREDLNFNTKYFLQQVNSLSKYVYAKGHPSFSFQDKLLSKKLENENILITNFRYPLKTSALMSRIIISAAHTIDDIDRLCTVLNSYD